MPAYFIADLEITDPAGFAVYAAGAPATIELYGGTYVARGGTIEPLEGTWNPKRLTIVNDAQTCTWAGTAG